MRSWAIMQKEFWNSGFSHLLWVGLANACLALCLMILLFVMVPEVPQKMLVASLGCGSLLTFALTIYHQYRTRAQGETLRQLEALVGALGTPALIATQAGETLYATPSFIKIFPETVDMSISEMLSARGLEEGVNAPVWSQVLEDPAVVIWRAVKPRPDRERAQAAFGIQDNFLKEFDLREIFDSAPAGILFLDDAGRIKVVNKTFVENFLKLPSFEVGTPFVDLLIEDRKLPFTQICEAFSQGNSLVRTVELQFRYNPEAPAIAYIGALTEGEAPGVNSRGIALYVFDNSEQQRIQLHLVQSQKLQAMGRLAGGIAHDFNNLLTAMIGFCDLLLLRHSPGDQSFTDIMQIKQNANRAANLVRQLLAFSRQQTLQPKVLVLSDALANLSVLLQRLIGPQIKFKMVHGRDLGVVKVDQGQLEQVIINLVVNARDAIDETGEITIRTSNKTIQTPVPTAQETISVGSYVMIEVIDTGKGIPEESLVRIFDPFYSTKEVGSGTGLGLATVYGILKQTGGYVQVESEVGRGTKFSILLPKYQGAQVVEAEKDLSANENRDLTGQGAILLVEDEDAVRLFSVRALRDKGYRVLEAASGEEGLAVLTSSASGHIDLLITDVVMPHMDGPTLVAEALKILPELKVIYISGYAEDSFRRQLDQTNGVHFLPKPFSLKVLATKVKEVLEGIEGEATEPERLLA